MPLVAPFFNEALLRHSECTRHRRARPQRGRTNCPHMPSTRRLLYDTYIMQVVVKVLYCTGISPVIIRDERTRAGNPVRALCASFDLTTAS